MTNAASPEKKNTKHAFGRFLAFLGVTLLCLAVILLGIIWVLERGPSPTVTGMFTRSVRETSAIRWISNIFLTDSELEQYKSVSTENQSTESINTSLIHIAEGSFDTGSRESVQLIDIAEGTCKGKLLIVSDPKQVILGISDEFVKRPGLLLTDMVAKYDGIAGINAGGFNDENGRGNGSTPQGLVISNGEIVWGDQYASYHGLASSLIINGEVQWHNLGGGVNPRTAIGQRQDGALLLLVLDGRSINTLGATMEDVVNIMLEYGAVNAGNLDGGSSSVMVYGDEIINHCASVTGPRRIPTGFIVLKEGADVG